jgi:exoribonuclease-2
MLKEGSLLLYKGRAAVALGSGEKAEILLQDGQRLKVREKDALFLHPGPLKAFDPEAALAAVGEGDYETARAMVDAKGLPAAELAELVYGKSGALEVWAVTAHALSGDGLFLMEGDLLFPLSEEKIAEREKKKRERDEARAARDEFVSRAHRGAKDAYVPAEPDQRFLQEIEARASGGMTASKLMKELGLEDSPEAAHAFLLKTGIKTGEWNPYPLRAGFALKAPAILIPAPESAGREDLTGMEALAIDNAWSNDPDDAVSFDGGMLWVHVADPASTVLPGGPADIEARARAATLYLPEGIVPMLPDQALERFGLGLSETSPAISFGISLDGEGAISDVKVLRSVVRVRRLSYEGADAEISSGILPALDGIAKRNKVRREANGAIDISLPEVRVKAEAGGPEIFRIPETRSSGIVRECMVLAGEGAARFAFREGIPFPYYGQEAPGEGRGGEGLAGEYAKRRLMRPGMISGSPVAHQGLGLSLYTQATSPLRRYQDLLAHQQLGAYLAQDSAGGSALMSGDEIIEATGAAQAQAAQVRMTERLSLMHWKIVWLQLHKDEILDAIVVGYQGPRAVLLIPSLALETQIALGDKAELNSTVRLAFTGADLAKLEMRFQVAK